MNSKMIRSLVIFMMTLVAACTPGLLAQTTGATLSGIVADSTGARIPDAQITLTLGASGSKRTATSNAEGVYSFNALEPGIYTMHTERDGFAINNARNITLHPADVRTMNIMLQIGANTETIEVDAADEPPTSGERTALISADDIQHLSVQGRDVSELVKTQPGFAIIPPQGLTNGTYDPGQVTVGGGLGNFSANGAPNGGISISANGADITDPTTSNSTTQNINQEMVSEVQISTSAFGADQAKGPININVATKAGTRLFHGSAYTYFRSHSLNTENWFSKNQGLPDAQDRYLYPGAQISGPILVPGTSFNRSKKLTFFVGAEDYVQRGTYAYGNALQSSILALVPTANMRNGNFTAAELANYLGTDAGTITSSCGTGALANYIHLCGVPTGTTNSGVVVTNGNLGVAGMDPNARILMNTMPLPNRPTTGGYNYVTTNFTNNDLWQIVSRVDANVSDRFKMYFTYSAERGRNTGIPEAQYYSPANGGPLMGGVDTPGKSTARVFTQSASINTTWILNSHMTNEAYISSALNRNDFALAHPEQLYSSTLGYTYSGIYPNATKIIPSFADYNADGLPIALYPDTSNGPYFTHTFTPTFGDNFSDVWRTHTFKIGVYVQRAVSNVNTNITADQVPTAVNGLITQYYLPNGSSITNPDGTTSRTLSGNNYLADFAIGDITQFFQTNQQRNLNLYYWNTDFFATDTWKVTNRLTLTLGLRFDHLGAWQDTHGNGIAVFSDKYYNNPVIQSFPGLSWHGIDPSLPNSGTPGRMFFYSPRAGLAYDLYGNGKTVLRGGFGLYRSHDPSSSYANAAATAAGTYSSTAGGAGINLGKLTLGTTSAADCTNRTISQLNSKCPSLNSVVYGLSSSDDQQPLTYTYNFTVTQAVAKKTVFQIGYAGSRSQHLLLQGGLQNVNALPIGALFAPNPITGVVKLPTALSIAEQGDFRRYKPYQAVEVPRHLGYSNYNALQIGLNRTAGHLRVGVNYTWSKSLGIRTISGQPGDPIYLRNNYGPLNADRSGIFNATYTADFGTHHFAGKRLLGGVTNGWEASGITGYQAGPNIQANYSFSFKAKGVLTQTLPGGTTQTVNVNNTTFLGTPEVSLQPLLTCDPRTGLKDKQYVRGDCFQLPGIGTKNGPFNYPYIHGPAYFSTDLTVVKHFRMGGQKDLQFRFAAFNFLNHPITSYSARFPNESNLIYTGSTTNPVLSNPDTGNCSVIGSQCFGYAGYKQGRRVVEVAAKYSF
ncbi:carboxypeptidase regulatory-like domain-containing protein [Granulicella cerasi]|uniref:Carboxypeptidase regulatory-like domain-containing protein n=1 Tax=Granulicella cerasi TaxID=741063 RepID=A0ABW1ZAS8_9BACT|nr:TonB-dependent receptor [Granulicella cerasi]